MVYQTADRPGALMETLKVFFDRQINLVKLESRPIHGKPWEYMFYVDVEADAESEAFKPVLNVLNETHRKILTIEDPNGSGGGGCSGSS